MFHIFLIIFRELLEVLLMLSVLITLAKNYIPNLTRSTVKGLALGLLGCIIIALCSNHLTFIFEGLGQEIVSSAINLITAFLIGFTIVWMPIQQKSTVAELKNYISKDTVKIEKVFIGLVAIAVLREGVEILLLASGVIFSKNLPVWYAVLGALGGTLAAICCALLFYLGFSSVAKIFKWISLLFTFISSGLASEGVGILSRSGIINFLSDNAWNSSWLVSETSIIGQILKILINYNSSPSVIEVMTFCLTFASIYLASKVLNQKSQHLRST